jgi:hypothetical protein
MDHEVLDFPIKIVELDKMNMRQENLEEGHETETMEEPQTGSETVLLQRKEILNDYRDIKLSDIFKEK